MSNQIGRAVLYTDVKTITYDNVIPVLQKAMSDYQPTINKIDFLLNYEAGIQPLQRKKPKTYRPDIDFECVDNIANEIVEFKLGFNWGNPITLVQRGEKDSGTEEARAISLLNECYEAEKIKQKTQELARFIEICGIGYSYVEINKDYEPGDSYFKIETLDPRYAFVVRSNYYMDNRVMLGVSYRIDSVGNKYFTCFSKDRIFIIKNLTEIVNGERILEENRWQHQLRSGEENPLHKIPIIEYIRSFDRMGCFERQIPEMDNLNLLVSDFTNDVDQNTQAIWHTNDVDFPEEEVEVEQEDGTKKIEKFVKKPKAGDWMRTYTPVDGKTPIVEALAINYDYEGILNNILARRSLILQKCDVPSRNDNSGGSTGVAMDSATGYADAETAAAKEQNIIDGCKMEEVKVALSAIRESTDTPTDSPLLTLTYMDVQPSIKRNKNFETTVKVNGISALIRIGFSLEDCLNMIPIAEDPSQVILRSGPGIRAYQEANVFKIDSTTKEIEEKRPFADLSDQVSNSPLIDGMETA